MAKDVKTITDRNPGMMFVLSFFLVSAVNAVVFYLANMWFPQQIVVGTYSLSFAWAILLSSGALSLFTILILPFLKEWEITQKRDMKPAEMMGVYLVINFVGLWLLTRFSEVFGIGVRSWLVVLTLAVVLDFLQGMVMMQVEQMRKK